MLIKKCRLSNLRRYDGSLNLLSIIAILLEQKITHPNTPQPPADLPVPVTWFPLPVHYPDVKP